MVTITYFVHGTTKDNENGIATGWLPGDLSQRGMQQSRELRMQIGDKKFDAIFTSDLKRAVDSAGLAFEGMAPFYADVRLRECNYGALNGTSAVTDAMQEQMINRPFPAGESYKDVERRIADFLNTIKPQFDGKHIAIVAHKGPQLALEVLLNGKTWEQAFAEDWRKTKAWQPGWEYQLK